MANKKIENKDLIADNLLQPTIKEFEELLKVVNLTQTALEELLKQSLKNAKSKPYDGYANLKDIASGIEDVDKAVEGLTKAEKERLRIIAEVNKATQKSQKSFEELEKQLIDQKKALSDLAKEQRKEGADIDSIVKKRVQLKAQILATTTAIRNEQKEIRKGLELQGKSNELKGKEALERAILQEQIKAEAKALREEAKERAGLLSKYQQESKRLNDLRKQYKELALTNKSNTKEGKALLKQVKALDGKLKALDKSVGQSQRIVGEYEKAWKGLKQEIKTFVTIGFVFKILEGLANAFKMNTEGAGELEKMMGRVTVALAVVVNRFIKALPIVSNVFTDWKNGLKRDWIDLQLSFQESPFGSAEKVAKLKKELAGIAPPSGADWADFFAVFEGTGDEIEDLVAKNDKLIDATRLYREEVIRLRNEQSKLITKEAELEIISGDNTRSLKERRDATVELQGVQQQLNDKEIEIAKGALVLAKLAEKVRVGDLSAKEDVSQKTRELAEAEVKAEIDKQNAIKELRDIDSDDIERRLDFLIDIGDKQKTSNDAIIADETKTFAEREKARIDNQRIESELFAKANAELNRATTSEIDLNELKKESDNALIADKSKNAGLNDRLVGRVLELIRDDIDFTREQIEGKKDLNEAESDSNLTKEESILLEEALIKSKKKGADLDAILLELSEKTLQSEIDNLNLKIALLKKGSEAEIQAQKDLNAKLLEQQQNKADKEEAIEAKKQERLAELAQLGVDSVKQFAQKSFDNTTANIDREISALEQRENTLRALAEKGVENVENNLAIEQKKRAELEAKRAQAVRRQQNIELGLSVLETYSNKVSQGDKNALGSTIADTSLLLSFISSLPAFYEGAERVGDELSPALSGKDGHIVRVDGDERILNPTHSKMIPKNISNLELATMAQMSSKGLSPARTQDNSEVVKELRELKTAIENKPVYDFKYDDVKKAVADVVESKGRRETNWRRNSDFF